MFAPAQSQRHEKSFHMTTHADELIRLLADSERRNAELAALIREVGGQEGRKMLEDHARECNMAQWHERFYKKEEQKP